MHALSRSLLERNKATHLSNNKNRNELRSTNASALPTPPTPPPPSPRPPRTCRAPCPPPPPPPPTPCALVGAAGLSRAARPRLTSSSASFRALRLGEAWGLGVRVWCLGFEGWNPSLTHTQCSRECGSGPHAPISYAHNYPHPHPHYTSPPLSPTRPYPHASPDTKPPALHVWRRQFIVTNGDGSGCLHN